MNYHRDKDYIENESLFRNIFQSRFNLVTGHVAKGLLGGEPWLLRGGRVLDIGCSNGVFLDLYKEEGWETWGVEPSEIAHSAKNKGHRIINTTFEKAELPENYFDLVILNHTLEHMNYPAKVLKKIHGLLRKGGILFVDVPNAGGFGARLLGKYWPLRLPQEHKWQFTPLDMASLFKKAGFEVIDFKSRSGIFEYANPFLELRRPRFLFDILTIPYSLTATLFNFGDSMSLIGRRQ